MSDLFDTGSAIISPCGLYRYRLERPGYGPDKTLVVMVNPSTANATDDDATIRKLKGFGARNGWGKIIVGNLFAYRATDVRELRSLIDPIGPDNDWRLRDMMQEADRVVFAWGPQKAKAPPRHRGRWAVVAEMARALGKRPYSIGEPAACGAPKHPLMLAYTLPIILWSPPA